MFREICRTLLSIIVIFVYLILAFALAFYALMIKQVTEYNLKIILPRSVHVDYQKQVYMHIMTRKCKKKSDEVNIKREDILYHVPPLSSRNILAVCFSR